MQCRGLLLCLSWACVAPSLNAGELYRERYRPQFHYTVKKGWINDPCGLVYHAGEYHLFNDHNPFGNVIPGDLGNTSKPPSRWPHAVSPDLVHWREMPIAILPDKLGAIFSGPGVVDAADTAGFGTTDEKTLVLVDRTSLETFGNDGKLSMSSCFLADAENRSLEVYTVGGDVRVVLLKVHELKSSWPEPSAALK